MQWQTAHTINLTCYLVYDEQGDYITKRHDIFSAIDERPPGGQVHYVDVCNGEIVWADVVVPLKPHTIPSFLL